MTTVLVVDDQASNRDLLVTLLGYAGYDTHSAPDGRAGLALVRATRPALVVCDILMPHMDGYEFVRQLRADAALADTRVLFYTAHYLEDEAARLAAAAGVSRVLIKPAEPEEILAVVKAVLAEAAPGPAEIPASFDHEHLRLLSDKLAGTAEQLGQVNAQLTRLVELNLQFACEQQPEVLLDRVCDGARSLLGARHAMLRVDEHGDGGHAHVAISGFEPAPGTSLLDPPPADSVVARVSAARRVQGGRATKRVRVGLPAAFPPFGAFLVAPVVSLTRRYGWLCVTDRDDGAEFSGSDAELLGILAAQVGRIYENGSLYRRVSRHAEAMEREVDRRARAERLLTAQHAVSRVLAESNPESTTTWLLLKTLGTELGFTTAALWEVDAGIGSLRRAAAWPDDQVWAAMVHAPTSSVAAKVWRDGTPLWVSDVARSDHAADAAVPDATGSALAFPIYLGGEVKGVIELRSSLVQAIDRDLVESCRTIGTQVAQYLERRAQQRNIERLNRTHRMLSGINSAIVRIHDRHQLFEEACRIAVELGDFDMAWIGARASVTEELRCVALAGAAADVIGAIVAVESPVAEDARGVIAHALRTAQAVHTNDVLGDAPHGSQRYTLAVAHGYRSAIALPLLVDGEPRGCLALFSRQPEFFNDDELALLDELAGDIAFALRYIEHSEELAYLAQHDPLTGLLNRSAFLTRLATLIETANHRGTRLAVIIGNLRRFRYINESLGRQQGDALLIELARRLRDTWPVTQNLARVGADGFAGVLTDLHDLGALAHALEGRLRGPYAQPFELGGQKVGVGFALGIAVYPGDGEDAETLYQHAEAALDASRTAGDRYRFYQPGMTVRIAATLQLETRLHQALEAEQFVLHYQPKVDVASRSVTGFEALLRWNDPERGLVAPGEFIPVLEESGRIVDVGLWAMSRALEDDRRWRSRNLQSARIAVNVSARQLQQPNFVESVRQAVRAFGGGVATLDFEITESMIMANVDAAIVKLTALREMGINIAIDDFGTGYSSLAYLARLPVTALKIDRSFVATMTHSPESMSIVSTTISLAHSLDLKVIAEGVEDEEQAKLLRLLRCDQMQGYLVSRPRPVEELEEFLR